MLHTHMHKHTHARATRTYTHICALIWFLFFTFFGHLSPIQDYKYRSSKFSKLDSKTLGRFEFSYLATTSLPNPNHNSPSFSFDCYDCYYYLLNTSFVAGVIDGNVPRILKSEPEPAEDTNRGVQVAVGTTVNDIVSVPGKDVLLLIYSPTCSQVTFIPKIVKYRMILP